MDTSEKRGKAYSILIMTTMIYGLNLIAVKVLIEHSEPITITGSRLLIAGLMILLYVLWSRQYRKISLRHSMNLLWICLTGIVLHHCLFTIGLMLTSAVHAALIMALTPLITSFLAFLILKDRLTLMKITGIFLGIIGITFIIWNDMAEISINIGDLLILAAVVVQSLSFVLIKKLHSSISDSFMTCILLTSGGVMLLILGWFVEKTSIVHVLVGLDVKIIILLLFSALLPTALGTIVWYHSLRVLGPGRASIFLNAVPFYGIFGAAILLREQVYLYHVLGLLVVITGVILGMLNKQPSYNSPR
jgi:drug/metabolite transporter (DMT)-like permease